MKYLFLIEYPLFIDTLKKTVQKLINLIIYYISKIIYSQ